jgi:K+/H+ antiporter YhaU regulatory subunit KhtT
MLAGKYTYTGVGTSRKTITNTRRSGDTILNRKNLIYLVAMCAKSEATANAYVASASEAQKAANMSLAEMSNIAKTTKQINKKKAMMYIVAAIEAHVEGDLRMETARSMANTITETCRTINTTALNANTSNLVDVAIKLERNTKNESLAATIAFYRVEDESIMLKKEIAQAELDSRKADVSRMEKKLKEALKTLSFLTKRFRKMNSRVVDAMRKVDKAGKALLAAKVALEVNLNATWSIHEEKLNNDYALAIATLKVEAADITFDSLKAFAGLIELLLPARLLDGFGLNDGECIEGEPTVSVEAVEIEGEAGVVSVSNCDA